MRVYLSTVLVLLLSFLASGAVLLALLPDSWLHRHMVQDPEAILSRIPDPAFQESLRRRLRDWTAAAEQILAGTSAERVPSLRPAAQAVAVRSAVALAATPLLATSLGVGVLGGLLYRHKLIQEFGFHSVTFSYIGKVAKSVSIAAYIFTALSPLGPPIWTLYLYLLTGAAGAAAYVGNLPPRI
jgi:hypothetical protein